MDFEDGASLEMNPNIETELVNATGRNYGIEFLFKKNAGNFGGWISYTYSRSLRKTQGIFSMRKQLIRTGIIHLRMTVRMISAQ